MSAALVGIVFSAPVKGGNSGSSYCVGFGFSAALGEVILGIGLSRRLQCSPGGGNAGDRVK